MELQDTVEPMLAVDWKDRFRAEYYQLKIRKERLEMMCQRYAANNLNFKPNCSLKLLRHQVMIMSLYLDILEERAAIEHVGL